MTDFDVSDFLEKDEMLKLVKIIERLLAGFGLGNCGFLKEKLNSFFLWLFNGGIELYYFIPVY